MGKAVELVPVVIDAIDLGLVGARQALLQLEIVGRVRKDQVNRAGRQGIHVGNAVAHEDGVDGERAPSALAESAIRAVRNITRTLTQY